MMTSSGFAGFLRLLGAVASGLLLASCFTPYELRFAAWFALVPLLLVARYSNPGMAFKLGMLCGFIFWLSALSWLLCLDGKGVPAWFAFAGWALLAAYCALYVAAFSMVVSRWFASWGTDNWLKNIVLTLGIPLLWVGFEYLRAHLFSGFPWNELGISQAFARSQYGRSICQLAEWGGVYAVSALIVLFNAGLAMTVIRHSGTPLGNRYRAHPELSITLVLVALGVLLGSRALQTNAVQRFPNMSIALVQPNVPQVEKWSEDFAQEIFVKLRTLTRKSVGPGLDLIVWPETSVPDNVLCSAECLAFMDNLLSNGVPILAGSTDARLAPDNAVQYYNCSILFQPGGAPPQIYDKQHLAPLGEYAPLGAWIPAIQRFAPEGWTSLIPGTNSVVFTLEKRPDIRFSALICFEDAFPGLARDSVRKGARLLIDQSNDAWFDVSGGPRQHLAHCTFRCIENRVPCVRATNTGISCVIDTTGSIPADGELAPLVEGFLPVSVAVPGPDMPLTFYTRNGDILALPCGLLAAACFVLVLLRERRIKSAAV